jgi:hypothetical protein
MINPQNTPPAIPVRFGDDRGLVEDVLRKAGARLEILPELAVAPTSGIWYQGAYFQGIEGAQRVAELYKEQR